MFNAYLSQFLGKHEFEVDLSQQWRQCWNCS